MSEPTFTPLNTGDVYDDDPQVIDSLVQSQANPIPPLPDILVTAETARPKRETRLQSGRITLHPGWDAIRLLTGDVCRLTLVVSISSTDLTDFVSVGDTMDSARYSGLVYMAEPLTLVGHTGAVWVYNSTINDIDVSYWAVTL